MRKIWGGGMRQAGIIAAGALYALRNNQERIGEDHEKARVFAENILATTDQVDIDLSRVQTNIVLLTPKKTKDLTACIDKVKERGVLLSIGSHGSLRAITHLDVSMKDCKKAAEVVVQTLG
jgi:threonine aldolase